MNKYITRLGSKFADSNIVFLVAILSLIPLFSSNKVALLLFGIFIFSLISYSLRSGFAIFFSCLGMGTLYVTFCNQDNGIKAFILLIYFSLFAFKRVREKCDWLLLGKANLKTVLLIILTISVSSLALIVWNALTNPDLSEFRRQIPELNSFITYSIIPIVATINAVNEEILFRGVIWSSLEKRLTKVWLIILIQSIYFGVCHFNGIPGGLPGIVLATIYGLALGYLKHQSKGLLYPIITHIFADSTIYLLILHSEKLSNL